ncbi:uncharacterized protein [Nicotiana sylvestris]|uniref:uncharacterized protein n=1 Tax=Nicotiana sylvestris TaxID=4096 RepID=UPI00388C98D3
MARQRKKNSIAKESTVDEEDKADDDDTGLVTPETGIPQALDSVELFHWMKGMGSAPTVLHGQERKKSEELVTIQAHAAPIAKTPADPAPNEMEMAKAARKLMFSNQRPNSEGTEINLAEVIKGNRSQRQGMQLEYYPPPQIIKDGVKMVRLNQIEVKEQIQKWQASLIGYVWGGNPSFKDMFKFVYGVWNFVATPTVFLHDDGYFVFKFESEDDKKLVIQKGPYTFNNRPMIMKQWEPKFQISKEKTRNIPIWVIFPGLPVEYWTKKNLGRIASCIGKPICSDRLTEEGERIHMLGC